MSFRSAQRSILSPPRVETRLAPAALFGLVLIFVVFLSAADKAGAGIYNMVLCAANNGSNSYATATNTVSGGNPGGIFNFENYCGPAPFPAGGNGFLRIVENQSGGNAGYTAYGSISWTVPPWVAIVAGGGYTREPNSFNQGWRARFWAEDFGGGGHEILAQEKGMPNQGIYWAPTSTFAPHLWPFGSYGDYRRFVFEVTCMLTIGCDRTNFNAADANTFVLTLADRQDSQVGFTGSSTFMQGGWVRGAQTATFSWTENGSGIRYERIRIDGAERWSIDHVATGECNRDSWGGVGEFARNFQPCATASNIGRGYSFDTASLPDGAHSMTACTQDYSQWTSSYESCAARTIHTDNSAPGAPPGLKVSSSNPERYLSELGVSFGLPPNSGSSITKVHYNFVNASGQVVQPEQVVSGTNPTELKSVVGPKVPGEYRLRVWLEDQVGWVGPASTVAIPRDTVAPAAPQDIAVTAPETLRGSDGFDVRWRNILDRGSPIDEVHYQVLNGAGAVVVPEVTVDGDNPQTLVGLDAPEQRGDFVLKMWLSDAEGNVGAPATVPLAYRCVRSGVGGGSQLSAEVDGTDSRVVAQGEGASLEGSLRSSAGPVAGASVCVFSNVVTDPGREFLGLAVTGRDGGYRFEIVPGPSRNLFVNYRPEHRELSARARIETIVHPTFRAKKRVVRNKEFARFYGEIPAPHNDRVVVVLQARRGKGWIAFRRYRTRNGGKFNLIYRFHNTTRATNYVMRAQVRQTTGYPYLQGNSDRLTLKVLPARRVGVRRP
jgi:hypothetical protein